MPETPVLMEHCLDSPGIFKAAKVIVHVEVDPPDLRVAVQKRGQRHMGSPAQREAVAVPFPALDLLQRGMGEGVNGRLKDRHMTAARIFRREAETIFLVAAVNVFPEAAGDTAHTGKLRFPRIVFPDEYADRLAVIPGFIEDPQPEAPADNLAADPTPLQIENRRGGAPLRPGELERLLFLRLCCRHRRTVVRRRLPDFSAHQLMHRIHQPVAPDLDQVIQGVDTPATAVPVPVAFPGHIDQAVMLFVPVIRSVPFQHPRLIGLQIGKQVSFPRRLDLLPGYAGHNAGTQISFIVLSPPYRGEMKKDAEKRLTAVQVVVDLSTVVAVHRRRGVIQCRHQVSLDIADLRGILVDTVKDILQMAGIDL